MHLSDYAGAVNAAVRDAVHQKIASRIWAHDHTVWKSDPSEITNRLGWLDSPVNMRDELPRLTTVARRAVVDGFRHAVLLGMGGSSLAPELFAKTFGPQPGFLSLEIVDTTDPDAIRAIHNRLDPATTLFIVSSKSGGTVETISQFKYFFNLLAKSSNPHDIGRQFIAITDPGSALAGLAERHRFRDVFQNDPNIGGRYSALSFFGLLPAALLGLDLELLTDRAAAMRELCRTDHRENPALHLGAALGALANAGRDKLTFITSASLVSFADWVEQLIAESTGKAGRGILPIVGEDVGAPEVYNDDRAFVSIRLADEPGESPALRLLRDAGHPVFTIAIDDMYDLAGQFFLWEFATAVAGWRLGINPFDQPNVEKAKARAREALSTLQRTGGLREGEGRTRTEPALTLRSLDGDYIAIHAYIAPTVAHDQLLSQLRHELRDHYHVATTVGYGPRFLHSTGQLHKGDAGKGLFLQITCDPTDDIPIPDDAGSDVSSMSFGTLRLAQSLGDAEALRDGGRRVIRIHLPQPVDEGLRKLLSAIG